MKVFAGKFIRKLLEESPKKNGALVLALAGELGSGKTTFAQGAAFALGIEEKVLSPTFVIVKSYTIQNATHRIQHLVHIDCYRLENDQDMLALGWDNIVSDPANLVLVEWPERIKAILPENTIFLSFETTGEHERRILC